MSSTRSYRLTILYGHPDDPNEFDRYYREVHIPCAMKMRGLTGWTLSWCRHAPDGTPPAYHLIADLYAPNKQAMQEILNSPEGKAAASDVANFATGGVTFVHGDEQQVLPTLIAESPTDSREQILDKEE